MIDFTEFVETKDGGAEAAKEITCGAKKTAASMKISVALKIFGRSRNFTRNQANIQNQRNTANASAMCSSSPKRPIVF